MLAAAVAEPANVLVKSRPTTKLRFLGINWPYAPLQTLLAFPGAMLPLRVALMESNIHHMRTEPPLLAPIFRSEGQARLLAVALLDGEYGLAELAERAGLAYPTAHREVGRLLEAGILAERVVGRVRLIRANESSPLVAPLADILQVTAGPAALLKQELEGIDGIESAFLYGSFAARTLHVAGTAPNDIDVMVIGTPDAEAVYDACARVETMVRRPVNPTIMTRDEASLNTGFLDNIRANPVVPVLGVPPWQ